VPSKGFSRRGERGETREKREGAKKKEGGTREVGGWGVWRWGASGGGGGGGGVGDELKRGAGGEAKNGESHVTSVRCGGFRFSAN